MSKTTFMIVGQFWVRAAWRTAFASSTPHASYKSATVGPRQGKHERHEHHTDVELHGLGCRNTNHDRGRFHYRQTQYF
jgi:hypothetical protein